MPPSTTGRRPARPAEGPGVEHDGGGARGDGRRTETPMGSRGEVRVRRVYEEPADDDGQRVLVDRVWPRGLSKERAHLDQWCKQVAPSTELRKWYGHEPDRFDE